MYLIRTEASGTVGRFYAETEWEARLLFTLLTLTGPFEESDVTVWLADKKIDCRGS